MRWPAHVWVAIAASGVGAYPALLWGQIGLVTLFVPWCGLPQPAHPAGQDWSYSCADFPTFLFLLPLVSLAMIAGGALWTLGRYPARGLVLLGLGTGLLWVVIIGGVLTGGAYFFFFGLLLGLAAIVATAACYMAGASIVFRRS